MRGLSKIIEAAQYGALDAQEAYSKWSGGLGVEFSGVESFVSAKIAERIHTDLSSSTKLLVGMEYPVQQIMDDIGRKIRGRKGGRLNDNGRVDVIVWGKDELPRVLIEVKRQFRWTALQDDADRLRQFIKKFGSQLEGGSIEAGIIVVPFITWRRSGSEGTHPRASVMDEAEERAADMGFKMEKIISKPLDDDDKLKYPDEEGHEKPRENLFYNSACFSIRASNF